MVTSQIIVPLNNSLIQNDKKLENILTKYTNENVYIAGAFNVDLMNPDNNEINCLTTFFSHSYKSPSCIPNRVTDQSSTCLEHIWTNSDNVEFPRAISDINITDYFSSSILFSFH